VIKELIEKGLLEDEIVEIVTELFACDESEAEFIIDLELGKDVGCFVAIEEES
jgi:hypothetical protein